MFLHVSICSQGGRGLSLGGRLPTRGVGGVGAGGGQTPPGARKVGGTHPTGMLSCFILQLCITTDVASLLIRS